MSNHDQPGHDQLSHSLPTPLYHQIQLVLQERIDQGVYGAGDLLPSEIELSREFNVSRITMARAINELAALDIVERRRGAGTRIKRRPMTHQNQGGMEGLLQNLIEMAKQTDVQILEFGYVPATPEVQARLGVAPDELVQRAVRVRSYQGVPFSYLTSFVPERLGRSFDVDDLKSTPLLTLIERSGVRVSGAKQSFGAVLADPRTAQALGVAVGSPLLSIVRTVSDWDQTPIQFIRIFYRPDRYQYHMTLERESDTHQWVPANQPRPI